MSILERRVVDNSGESYFLKFVNDVTSQNGEDGIFQKLFELIGTSENPFCIDVGAWDGIHLSNTFNLLTNKKWGGILFEADSERCEKLKGMYKNRDDIICVNSLVQISGDNSLGDQLSKYNVSFDIDFITIDIDGADYHVWKGIGTNYRPRVVCIEFNPTIPNDVYFIQEADTRIQQGSSLLALKELGSELGYTLVVTTIFNAIFVRNDLMHFIPHFNMDINTLHTPVMTTSIFQTYDGELKLVGCKKLYWHRLAINPQKLQVLDKKSRHFPFAPTWDANVRELQQRAYEFSCVVRKARKSFCVGDCSDTKCDAECDNTCENDVELTGSFQALLQSANHLISVQFLEGVIVETLNHALIEFDRFVSEVCCSTATRSVDSGSNSPVLPNSQAQWHASSMITTARTLHAECSLFYEARGDVLARSGLSSEVHEWFIRALHALKPSYHVAVTMDVSHSNRKLSADRETESSAMSSHTADIKSVGTSSNSNSQDGQKGLTSNGSCHDFLTQYSRVEDLVGESEFAQSLQEVRLHQKLAQQTQLLGSYAGAAHHLHSGMEILCNLASSDKEYSDTQSAELAEMIQSYWKAFRNSLRRRDAAEHKNTQELDRLFHSDITEQLLIECDQSATGGDDGECPAVKESQSTVQRSECKSQECKVAPTTGTKNKKKQTKRDKSRNAEISAVEAVNTSPANEENDQHVSSPSTSAATNTDVLRFEMLVKQRDDLQRENSLLQSRVDWLAGACFVVGGLMALSALRTLFSRTN